MCKWRQGCSLEAAVLVRKLHFGGHEGKCFGIIKLHCSFQTKSRYHNTKAAALHDARYVATFHAAAQFVTLLHFATV
jgi:hypothetical protein